VSFGHQGEMDLRNLIDSRHFDLARLSKDLDEIGHFARLWSVHQWTRADMARVWEAAKGFRAVHLNDLVPPSTPPLVEVIHDGKNSLPAFTVFQKRFCRPADPTVGDLLIGYNHQSFSLVTGPGYYVARRSAEAGELDLDHTILPKEKSHDWPPISSNDGLVRRFVYYGLVDVVRGLSSHVTIGRVKKGNWLDSWFVLVREDATALSSVDHAAA
jgi:hypothetical protein